MVLILTWKNLSSWQQSRCLAHLLCHCWGSAQATGRVFPSWVAFLILSTWFIVHIICQAFSGQTPTVSDMAYHLHAVWYFLGSSPGSTLWLMGFINQVITREAHLAAIIWLLAVQSHTHIFWWSPKSVFRVELPFPFQLMRCILGWSS